MKTFSINEVLRFGWEKTKDNYSQVFAVMFILILFTLGDHAISTLHHFSSDTSIGTLRFFLNFALVILGIVVGINIIKQGFKIVRGGKANLRSLLHYPDEIWKYIGGQILSMFLIIAGFIFFIIPGIIILIRIMFLKQILVDQKLGILDSFTRAFDMTRGHTKELLFFLVIVVVFNLAGLLFFIIGLAITIPTTFFGILYLYDKLNGATNKIDKISLN